MPGLGEARKRAEGPRLLLEQIRARVAPLQVKQIDHDRAEPPRDRSGNGVYWANLVLLLVLWIWVLHAGLVNWQSIALGFWSGALLATWAIELTGNKVPRWMRR